MADLQIPTSSANETAGSPLPNPSTTNSQSLYDVFINHRGVDVKKSMASILYHSLKKMGLRVFLDSGEFKLGDPIPDVRQHAILSSSVQIAILSENYADSPWCLAELALMLETDAKIVPVFYHVPPSDPRYCLGVYAEAFRKHESDGRYSNAEIKKWKEALHKASNLKGWELNGHNEDEGQLWKDIVDTVLEEVKRRSPLEVAEHPVGLKEAVDDFNRRRERENNPKLVGIVGMCGSGKTTLAAELFNVKRSAFDASCFLHDVCKTSAVNNLATLQRIILKRLLNLDLEINNEREGKGILRDRFAQVETTSSFLIILDGIDHQEQVDALLVQKVLQTNSLIIITSRDRSVFPSRPQAMLYEMKSMAEKHARELFCRHAFNQPSPVIGSENVVDGFMRQCDGLPLLLKEFGALLNGKSEKKEWEIELHNSFKRLNRDIKNKLQTIYDALERDEKEMFQDVSCFFTGHPENTAIRIWNASGWSGDIGLQTLKYKSLIEVHRGGELSMHDLFKYFGRDVASDKAGAGRKFPRIWKPEDINKLEREGLEDVLRNGHIFRSFLHLPYSHGGRSSEVHFFVGNDHLQPEVFRSYSELLWLKWENCPHKCIPSWIPMESLRHLEVIDGDLEHLWQANFEGPLELTQLIIQRNPLTVLPMNFGCLRNLLHIDFHGCNQLEKFDLSRVFMLECLCLSGCSRLKRISGMCDLVKLKELAISGCCELEDLPSLAPLTALERFTADQCWKLHNIGGVEVLKGLKEFRLVADNGAIWNCFHGLQRLPSQEMILGGRAAAVAELGDEEWINFSASDDPDGTTYVIGGDKIKLWGSLNTTSVVTIICLVIESFSENSSVRFWGSPGVLDLEGNVHIKAGEWIIASVFATEWKGDIANLKRLQVLLSKSPHYKLKKAFIAMVNKGGEDKITEFLNEIFVSKKDARAPEQSEPNFKLQESVKVDNVLSYLIR